MPSEVTVEIERKWLDLSLAQQSIWLDAKLSGSSVYLLGSWARIAAPLDESAVRQAASLIMARHDGLRLRVDDELPRQWLDDSVEPPLRFIDLPSDVLNTDEAFHAHVAAHFSAPIPLGDHSLFDIEVIRAGKNLNYLLWRFHHLVADTASVALTLHHWLNAYEALTSGTAQELATGSSYLKVISADAAYLESAAYHKDLAYWSNRFEPLPPPLIAEMEARATDNRHVPIAEWKLAGEEFAAFQKCVKAAKSTVQRALFSLFAVAMGRRYGQTDVVSGVALHRRDLANRHSIGMMAGVLAVRCQFESYWTLEECVQAFSEQLDQDLRHQRLPIDMISRALGLAGTGRAGLFEAAMSYMPLDRGFNESAIEGLPVVTGGVETKEASPISLHADELASGLAVKVAVNTDFLAEGEAQTLLLLLQAACEKFMHEPETRFENLTTLTGAETNLVVDQGNQTKARFETGTLHGLFSAQALRTPTAVAIVGRDGHPLTYAELDAQSTRLARQLVASGVKAERVVGVKMERSTETIVALLGILKAGGVYLPLDPAYPSERLEYIRSDAGATLVLESLFDLYGEADVPAFTDPSRLAYVIYTSGTTGLPKGVEVSHAAPVNLAFARRACHDPLGEGDRVLAGISVGFDVSIGQLLLPLLSGAAVVIAGDLKTMGAAEFWALLAERRVTHINSVPSFFDSILDAAPAAGTLALKRLMLGGEALSGALVARIQSALPGVEIVNMYGPTEACIDATFHVATPEDLHTAVLPIGKPLSNYRAYVLDNLLEPLGVGVTGELYLGGSGLARGYVNAPDLTAERFVADPFSSTPGARLYRTGDRARWRSDGSLEFLGRVDQQVKIRGFRVEPGEITAILLSHSAIAQAVVVPRASQPGGSVRLIAYIVPRDKDSLAESAELRAFLAKRLPDYMVPSAFVPIDAIPLSRNGKLDEKALPSPDLREGEFTAPRTPTEETVAALFADVLGLDNCGATDHFFELGGHSLLATTLVSKLRTIGIKLPLRAIFESPTVETLARRIDTSLPTSTTGESITPQVRPAEIPLSYPQERIWFVDRLQQDSSYNIPIAFELIGLLDVAAVEKAMQRLVSRHEALRTRIILRNERPLQEILEPAPLTLPKVDLSQWSDAKRETALRESLAELAQHRFDLANDIPFQLRLIVLTPTRHVLAAVIHHVAFDGWSSGLFLSEFAALYSAFSQKHLDPLPAPVLQYADFALWQRQQNWDADLAYWLEELQGAPAYLELPSRDLPVSETARISSALPFQLDATLHASLQKLARDNGASLFIVLHAAFALLLSKWSGQDDVVIGTVTANRNRSEWESIIGCFVNTLALRTKFEVGESFAYLLNRIKSSDLSAFAHQDLPFEHVVEALHPERSLEHTPVFQVMLVLQNAPLPPATLSGLTLQPISVEAEIAKFDLTMTLAEQDGALAGTLEYAQNRFESEAMSRFARQFQRILETVAATPEVDVAQIDILDQAERALVTQQWIGHDSQFPKGTLDNLFAEQVKQTPDALAVIGTDGHELTYAQLDAQATQLARYLIDKGVTQECVVGVRIKRSPDTIIALLAILKAGGVYLPLDPAYPADRLDYMAQDARALLVLESIQGLTGDADLPHLTDANRLAYIIYTSGTTGRPKGVAVSHVAPVNLAFARNACHDPISGGDRVLAAISVGFDVSIGQLLLPLLSGATVVIADDLKTMGASEFWALLASRRVTHINSVPSFFDSILDSTPHAGTLALKRLMLGGEPLSGALVARIQHALPGVEVVNMYGPTEACIDATYHLATSSDLTMAVLPIGKPLTNYRAYVLGRRMEPLGIGVIGELYLGGAGLAHGNVNAPELTAERFVADPFKASSQLYRTGDLARWRADGSIEFLGRADEQVKIRGFRVEPGEVEAQLRKQKGIREAAVIAQNATAGTRLVAYYTGETAVDLEALRAGMAAALPDYMVPAAFVKLAKLPLSANGKLDRKALPNPDQTSFVARVFEAPVGATEEKMASVWAELLKHDRIGRHDNFFELGGHSLLAVTLIERMKQQGLPCDVRALFLTPTIAGIAAALHSESPRALVSPNRITPDCTAITPELLPLVKLTQEQIDRIVAGVPGGVANVQDIYPLAPLQEGILFQHRMTAQGDPYLTPFLLAFDSRHRLDVFVTALNQVVQRHDVLRTAMIWKELDQPLQIVQRQATVTLEGVQLDSSFDAAVQLTERFNPRTYRLDLTKAPLLHAIAAYDERRSRWLLLMLTHHLILDHTSMEILVHELRTLMTNPDAVLPPSLPYRNFIAESRAGVDAAEQQAFFTRMLADVEEPTAPFGLLDVQSNGGETHESRLTLDPALARRIREQARALGVTPASLFHTAWAAVLAQLSDKSNVVFGTVLFGRMRSGTGADRVVGMFINTLPIRLDIDGTGVADSVLKTHRLLAELMAHEHAPLTLAQRCSSVPSPAPLFSSLFNYRYSPAEHAEVPWPGVEMVDAAERTNYPLAMAIDDSGTNFLLTALAHPLAGPERTCKYLQQTLTGLVDLLEREPRTPIESLQILPRTERHLVTEEWNRTDAKLEQGTLDGLFSAQARRTPSALAVVGRDGTQLTYAELDAASTQLARQLVAQGVRPERAVGVRMERSSETIIALLAILKAGGVYLPLDPSYPADRLDYIAKDAGAMLVLESIHGLDGEADLPQLTDPNRLAYIIYTSGTTGRPKGVAVAHAAPVNLAFARRVCHDPIGPGDRILAAISVGFDVSIGQLLLPLLSGAAVVIADDLKTMRASEFWALLAKQRVTHINSVPSFLDSILDAAPPADTLALRRLMLGGEALSGALVTRIQHALPSVEVVNMYGPTEACIDATYHVATPADLSAPVLPIGRPLTNYRAYILDRRLEPVGIGVMGELYLGGAGLARGYVNAPELTAERFVGDPFAPSPGAKLYRTGDLARWRIDGCIEFLGRVDQQVKIRGFRVEPSEIEAQLRKQPGVREAAVIPHTTHAGTRLVAYYCADKTTETETLRAAMASELPDYMVPAAFVKLDKLPLSANGKLDRKALPDPDKSAFAARAYEAPIGPTEQKMAALWAELLHVEKVGRHHNFFELGGHSLLAMTLIERMQQQGLAGDVRALFTTPTIAGLAALSGAVSLQIEAPANRILAGSQHITPEMLPLLKLTQPQIDAIVNAVPGGAPNVQDIYPLAPLQEGILFQHLMTAEGDPYLAPFMLAFDNHERLDNFVQALQEIVKRHDVLRTGIIWQGVDTPLQVVLRNVQVPLEELSIDTADAATQLFARFDPRTFRLDLSKAPLLRTVATHDSQNNRWLLMMLTHHLILDHTSMAIVVGELRTLMTDAHAALPTPVPYRNFIAQALHGTSTEEHEAFFRQMLSDVDEPTAPFGLLDTQTSTGETADGELRLDPKLAQRIRDKARALGVTPASLFHVGWASVLSFISGKSDVVFGTVLLGRMRSGAGADRVVGMFINTLPFRFAVDQQAVAEGVVHAQQLLAELMAHEHAPLALAQRASSVPAPAPLFSSLLNYRYSPEENDETPWPGVQMIHASERTNYPVSMGIDDTGSGFILRSMTPPSVGPERVCNYLQQAMSGLVDLLDHAPETSLETLAVLPTAEHHLVTEEWNRTGAKFELGTLDSLFSAQAQRTPNAIAIIGKDGLPFSYAQLDAESTRLARQLVANGVQPERVVGVHMERSAETIIAMLAILKAGGVYLPLDPAYPPDRLEYITADAGAMLVLDSIHSLTGDAELPRLADASRLAYIIYTSGTTGKPKGVAVPHSAPVNLAFARRACHDPLGQGDRVLAAISVGFDVSIGQLLLPLLSGATVVIAGDLKTMGPAEFWSFLANRGVSHINSVPSFFDSILDAAPAAGTLALRRLMLGGETLSGALVARIQRALPGIEVVNMYGPTEACIDATFHIATDADLTTPVLPIGRPLSNYRAYILNKRLEPVGVGIPGELYLGGVGLARGYVNAPELTAERFVTDPFSAIQGEKLYRTGDRAQWRADGAIEFLGRTDTQIKIRGHRVEPGEIESQLRAQAGIREAVVAYYDFGATQVSIREAGQGSQSNGAGTRLVAYYTGDQTPSIEDLRAQLSSVLPDYMVPSAFVKLDQLPLSPNGKLDRKALPLDFVHDAEHAYEAPHTPTQIVLQEIFHSILGVHPIGIHDNFFSLGGHSLAAMRLINACNAQFKINLSLRVLFDCPTIAQLAAALESNAPAPQHHPSLVQIRAGSPNKRPLFCLHPAGGHVLGYSHVAANLPADQPIYGIQARALFPGQPLGNSIEEMATDYIAAIRSVQPHGPYQLMGRSAGGLLAYEMAQQLKAQGEETSFLCLLDTLLPDGMVEIRPNDEMLRAFATNFGLESAYEGPEPPPVNIAELFERSRKSRVEFQGIDLGQFERFHAVWCHMVNIYNAYQPASWPGDMVLFRALKRISSPEAPHEWAAFVDPKRTTLVDLDCNHDDFAEAWLAPTFAKQLERVLQEAEARFQAHSAKTDPPAHHGHLIPLQPSGTKRKLFCIHPAGGRAFCYLPLARELGTDQPVFGLRASGLNENETLATSLPQMAADYLAAIREIQPQGPYQLLGMSFGGLLAYEMAQQLSRQGGEVSSLILLDTSLPAQRREKELSEEAFLQAMAVELSCADLLPLNARSLTLPEIVELALQAGRLPAGFQLAEAERIAAVFRNNVRLDREYQPQKWGGSLLLLRALRRPTSAGAPPDWSSYVANLAMNDLDCTHSEIVTQAFSKTVAALIAPHLK